MIKPTQKCNLGVNDSVTVIVSQFGDVPLKNLKIAYQVNGGPVFLDTIKSSFSEIEHTFRQRQNLSVAGVYKFKIWLVNVNDDNINNDTLRLERIKAPTPTVDFTFLTACASEAVSFEGTGSIALPDSLVRYEWHFGDRDTASGLSAVHRYDSSRTYSVAFRAYTQQGCYGEIKKSVTIRPTPIPDFSITGGCQGEQVTFRNLTNPNGTTLEPFAWTFGNGDTSNADIPFYTYPEPGTYTVWLVARATNGCVDSLSKPITVYPHPTVAITPSDTVALITNGSVDLTATPGFPSYTWSNGQGFQQIIVNTPGRYTVIAQDAHACSDTSNEVVVIRVAPLQVTLGKDTAFCLGRSYTLSVPGTYLHYSWSTGDTTATITVDTSGVYTVTVIGKWGLTATDHILVTFTPLRNVLLSGLQPEYCLGAAPVTLAGTPTGGVFSGPGVAGDQFTSSLAGVGQHTLKYLYTNSGGCSGFDERTVLVRDTATPTIAVSGPISFCQRDSVTLTSSNPGGNIWSTGDTTASIVVHTSGTITVRSRRGACLSRPSASIVVDVRPLPNAPVITASGPTTFCVGDSVRLTSSTGPNTLWNNSQAGESIVVDQPGTYWATTSALGCSSDSSSPVTVSINNPPNIPMVTVGGSSTLCQGESVWLVAASFSDTITWNTGLRNDSLLVTGPGTYYATASYAGGCTSDTSRHISITVNPSPVTPVISASRPLTFCQGDSVILYARSAPGDTVVWSTGQRGDSIIVVRQSGAYSITTVNSFGCRGGLSGPVQVTATPLPRLATTGDVTLCGQDSTLMRMQTDLTNNLEATWLDLQGNVLSTGLSRWYKANNREGVPEERVFIARVNVIGLNCASYDTIHIRINPSPMAKAGRDTALCVGESAVLGEAASPVHQYSYQWSPAMHLNDATLPQPLVTNHSIPRQTVVYVLSKYDPMTGCAGHDSVNVFFKSPVQTSIAGPDMEVCSGTTVALEGQGSAIPEYVFRWSPSRWMADSTDPATTLSPVLEDGAPAVQQVYYLRIYSLGSECAISEDSITVTVHSRYERRPDGTPYCEEYPLVVPNIVTPNDDNHNETFTVKGLEYYPQSRLRVFNRWGKEVYSASPYRNGWAPAETGLYFYRLEVMNGKKSFTGWVEVAK